MASSRRGFLKAVFAGSSVLSFSPSLPAFLARAASADPEDTGETALVVVQLTGGNDGLNTVVPYADDVYGRSRRTLRLTAGEVHKIDAELGFHPQMPGFLRLLKEGHLCVVQGVGYPKSSRSHDDALRDWHSGRPAEAACQTGWLGRAMDEAARPGQPDIPGALVAPIAEPFALHAERRVIPAIRAPRQLTLSTPPSGWPHRQRLHEAVKGCEPEPGNPLLDLARRSLLAAHATSRHVEAVLQAADSLTGYPSFTLARQLSTVAQLLRASIGMRVFFAELGGGGIGGFDNHANQRDNHAALLRELSESVTAFTQDLQRHRLFDRVLLMTFSEFGRTVSENGRRGTDHGAAAPLFLVGGRVQGGLLGRHPSLTDLEADAPRFHTDFRQVYATVLERWLGYDAAAVLGGQYTALEVIER